MAENKTITLSGKDFVVFPKEDHLYPKNSIGVSLDISIPDWSDEISNQIVGNYGGQGWGLFLENGKPESYSLFMIDCGNNQLLKFNNDCSFSLQRSLDTTNITSQTVDSENNIYIFDEGGRRLYILDQYGVEISQILISDLGSFVGSVSVMKVVDNKIYILFEGEGVVEFSLGDGSYQDIQTNLLGESYHNNFEVLSNGTVVTAVTKRCSPMKATCGDDYFHIHGVNLYKNGKQFFFIGDGINSWMLDEEENIVIIYNDNTFLKINTDGLIIVNRIYHQIQNGSSFTCNKTPKKINMSQTKVMTENGLENLTWLLYEDGNYVLILDRDGNMVNCFPLSKFLDTENYDIDLSKSKFCYNGNFTSLNSQKSCEVGITTLKARVVVKDKCDGVVSSHEVSYDVSKLLGENNVAMTFGGGKLNLLVNNTVVASKDVVGEILYSTGDRRPIIVGANSGRYTALKKEEGLGDNFYLKGSIRNLNLYSDNEISIITDVGKESYKKGCSFFLKTGVTKNYIENVERFFLLRPSGSKAPRMNLKIYDKEGVYNYEDVIPSEVVVNETRVSKSKLRDLI